MWCLCCPQVPQLSGSLPPPSALWGSEQTKMAGLNHHLVFLGSHRLLDGMPFDMGGNNSISGNSRWGEVRWGETEQGSRCFSKRSSTQHWENILAVKIQRLDNSSDSPVQSKITREWRIWEIWNHADGKCTVLWSGTHQYVSPAAKVLSNVIHY